MFLCSCVPWQTDRYTETHTEREGNQAKQRGKEREGERDMTRQTDKEPDPHTEKEGKLGKTKQKGETEYNETDGRGLQDATELVNVVILEQRARTKKETLSRESWTLYSAWSRASSFPNARGYSCEAFKRRTCPWNRFFP